jgi:Family of unknown function (DUF6967)
VSAENKTRIATVVAPYRREVWLDDVQFESGMRLLRVTIKEGRRFTQLDLDEETADQWGQTMLDWARRMREGRSG